VPTQNHPQPWPVLCMTEPQDKPRLEGGEQVMKAQRY